MPPSPSFSAAAAPAFHVLRARPFSPRDRFQLPARGWRLFAQAQALTAEGPSCLYVGPIETASKEMLEALYQQARDSYYNGNPLIVDDMFDKIELKLRLYGSKSVVKYPRCSLKRQSTYADAEEDPSQGFALASIWLLFLAFGSSAILVPAIYVTSLAFADSINSIYYLYSERPAFGSLTTANKTLTLGLGYLVGYPLAYASIQALQGLWRNELVAMKGSCPNCGEEVGLYQTVCYISENTYSVFLRSLVSKSILSFYRFLPSSELKTLLGVLTVQTVMYVIVPWSSKQRWSNPSPDLVAAGFMVECTWFNRPKLFVRLSCADAFFL